MAKEKTSTALATAPSEAALAELRNEFPAEVGFQKTWLPRLSFKSQDVTEGKGKAMQVVTEAGTFFSEHQTEEMDDFGKRKWDSTELGKFLDCIIVYKRKQLRMYDEATEKYTSSPIYDTDDEIIPLFCDKQEVNRGTPAQLQGAYMGVGRNGKPKSDLEENAILYVLHDGELKQLNLRGSSMYNWKTYHKKTLVPAVLTRLDSEERENGAVSWNAVTFEATRQLNAEEVDDVRARVREIKDGIAMEKAQFGAELPTAKAELDEFDAEKETEEVFGKGK